MILSVYANPSQGSAPISLTPTNDTTQMRAPICRARFARRSLTAPRCSRRRGASVDAPLQRPRTVPSRWGTRSMEQLGLLSSKTRYSQNKTDDPLICATGSEMLSRIFIKLQDTSHVQHPRRSWREWASLERQMTNCRRRLAPSGAEGGHRRAKGC